MKAAPLLALLLTLAASCGGGGGGGGGDPGSPPTFEDGFESGLGQWTSGYDLPPDPNRPGEVVEWSIVPSGDQASEGVTSARFFLDGRQDDGTIWISRPFDVTPGRTHEVRVSFDLWSPSESFNVIARVAAYSGVGEPVREADFDTSQAANQVMGWLRYDHAFSVQADASGRIWVALGISAVFETEMTYYVDDVSVWLDPQ